MTQDLKTGHRLETGRKRNATGLGRSRLGFNMAKVFLGGTCADSDWRKKLIRVLQIDYFDPVVEDWTNECQAIETAEKQDNCNIHLYVITSEMIGTFSVAEAVESSMTNGKVCVLHVMPEGFDDGQLRSLKAVCDMVSRHGGISYIDNDLHRTARVLNYSFG